MADGSSAHITTGRIIGAGGAIFERAHVQHTTQLVNSLPLDNDDFIYLSELVDFPGSVYSERAAHAGIQPFSVEQVENQMQVLRDELWFRDPSHAPCVSCYDIREFVY